MSTHSVPDTNGNKNVIAVCLAAGSSSRFGSTKQLFSFRGEPLVRRAMRVAGAVCGNRTLLVTGHDWRRVLEACRPITGYFVHNSEHGDGMATSIALATSTISDVADAMMLLLADQPLITVDHLAELLEAWKSSPEQIVASGYSGISGPPVVFPRCYFAQLEQLRGDQGARHVLDTNASRLITLPFADGAFDIDREEDLEQIEST